MPDLFDRYRVIDVDSHVTEPADVWTTRVSSRWGDRVPHVRKVGARDVWFVGGQPVGAPGAYSMAGWDGFAPSSFPDGYEDVPRATFDARARLAHLDAEGIDAQVIYPNVGGFGMGGFLRLGEPELMLECVRAYNDWLLEWTGADPRRLLPVMATPFWDVAAAAREIRRSAAAGHRAVLMCGQPHLFDLPVLRHRHWDPIWQAAREAGLPISFHVGAGDLSEVVRDRGEIGLQAHFARASALTFLENSGCLGDLFFGGICHRFPDLRFVSVESGAGWIPFLLEAFDWQWRNGGIADEHPEYELLPSEYFRRQVYGCFWFEQEAARSAIERYPENILYETDFPHPTCMAPGPRSSGVRPREFAARALEGLPEASVRRVLHDNAASLYGLPAVTS